MCVILFLFGKYSCKTLFFIKNDTLVTQKSLCSVPWVENFSFICLIHADPIASLIRFVNQHTEGLCFLPSTPVSFTFANCKAGHLSISIKHHSFIRPSIHPILLHSTLLVIKFYYTVNIFTNSLRKVLRGLKWTALDTFNSFTTFICTCLIFVGDTSFRFTWSIRSSQTQDEHGAD